MQGTEGSAAPAAGAMAGASAAEDDAARPVLAGRALSALCVIARFHQVAADPAALAHQLGCSPGEAGDTDLLLRAAKHLGLKAKLSRSALDRLALTPLPAIALLRGDGGETRHVVLAQCDARRVLLQDPASATRWSRPRATAPTPCKAR